MYKIDEITLRYILQPEGELNRFIDLIKTDDTGGLKDFITIIGPILTLTKEPYRAITIENPMEFIERAIYLTGELPPNNYPSNFSYMWEMVIKVAHLTIQTLDYYYEDQELQEKLKEYSTTILKRASRFSKKLHSRLSLISEQVRISQRSYTYYRNPQHK